ncbi:hypothetical protein [Streptosporangium canum]|uniref:hypothetical protein n=1 Tax=Streptosporangium canum TaxID=324952 RepID=UPI003448B5EB
MNLSVREAVLDAGRALALPDSVTEAFIRLLRPCIYLCPYDELPQELKKDARPAARALGFPHLPEDVEVPSYRSHVVTIDCAALPADVLDIDFPADGRLVILAEITVPLHPGEHGLRGRLHHPRLGDPGADRRAPLRRTRVRRRVLTFPGRAAGGGSMGRVGSSASRRIIAISCARLGLGQSTPYPVQYDKYKAIRPAYVFSVLNARPAPRTPARYAHASVRAGLTRSG